MASRIEFAVSATPIFSHAAGEGVATDVVAADVGKTLGGSGSNAAAWAATEGYLAGDPVHKICASGSWIPLDTLTDMSFIFIKHSGFEDDARTIANTTSTIKLSMTGITAGIFAILKAGQAVVLPFAAVTSPDIQIKVSAGTVAVEYMATV